VVYLIIFNSTIFLALAFFYFFFVLIIPWISYVVGESVLVSLEVQLRGVVLFFLFVLVVISSSVFLYSSFYIRHSLWSPYYWSLLFSFFLVISFLVMLSRSLIFFLFWDLLGVTRFLLVLFYSNWDSYSGAFNTVLVGRSGDLFLLVFFSCFYLFLRGSFWGSLLVPSFIIFCVVAAFTKGAQFPFIFWLPMAMSAPTPISALVHSRTLVTAGLFLLYFFFYLLSSGLQEVFLFLRLLRISFSGLFALLEADLKKLVALSTLSQVRLCRILILLSFFNVSYFQIFRHAVFKSCLFLCVGYTLYMSYGEQDSRFGFNSNFIWIFVGVVCLLRMSGLFFLGGIQSKDLLLLRLSDILWRGFIWLW